MLWFVPGTYNIFLRQSYVSMLAIGGRDPHFGRGFLFVLGSGGEPIFSGTRRLGELIGLGKFRDF
jgi:hypothetical protein